jgi:hypothetical protein
MGRHPQTFTAANIGPDFMSTRPWAFERSGPDRVKKTRQNERLEPRSESIGPKGLLAMKHPASAVATAAEP